jgi:ribonuclease E
MRDSMKDDKARTNASKLSENGLLEINRQRLKKALQLRTHRPCPTCSGAGTIASPELVGLNILRRIETRAVTGRLGGVRVELHPELADALQNESRQELAALEREFDIEIEIIAASGLHRAEEHIDWRERSKGEERVPTPAVSAADLAEGVNEKKRGRGEKPQQEETEAADTDAEESKPPAAKEKSRRRRRGGRKHKKAKTADKAGEPSDSDSSEKNGAESETEAAAGADDAGAKPATKKRRRRPRRSRKKAAPAAAPTEAPAEEAPTGSDPFAY